MAMRDVSNMAHVEKFSNMVIPMLWLEIALPTLPTSLQNRFKFYLNYLPIISIIFVYGCYIGGIVMLLWATYRASQQVKLRLERKNHFHGTHITSNDVYGRTVEKKFLEKYRQQNDVQRILDNHNGNSSSEDGLSANMTKVMYYFCWNYFLE